MGYVFAMGQCFGCGNPFTFNPMKVPSILVRDVKQPVCLACVIRVNPMRTKMGLEPIVPLPGAYEECNEEELG